jgi:uncharacterized protein YfaS (alpha-2-macroglobulin family)
VHCRTGNAPPGRCRPIIRALLALLLLTAPALAQTQPLQAPPPLVPPVLDQLRRADGARIVPDRFLRRWDAITLLFPTDAGPAASGPEDAPDRLVQLDPPQPGAWTWLGPRTLQFRPTEPWLALAPVRVTLSGGSGTTRLIPLLPVPVATGPADSDAGQPDLDTLALTFTEPVDPAALLRALTIELRPAPGLTDAGAQPLAASDFDLRAAERAGPSDRQTYLLVLRRPIPDGRVAIVRLRLSDQPGLDDPIFEARIRSAAPFALTDARCGSSYAHETRDAAVRCTPNTADPGPRTLILQMNAVPEPPDIVQARDALRISPPVDDLAVTVRGPELRITARFAADTPYEVAVAPGALQDIRGRSLATAIRTRFSFAPGQPALAWDAAQGITERFGPQMVPLRGQGYDRADIRIHAIDPLSRDFWPFPRQPLQTQDGRAPPLPGKEPDAWTDPGPISADAMAARVQALGTPAVSALVDLPIRRGGVNAKFGLDLQPHLSRISGEGQPGTYLVGLRTTDGEARRWMRVQVTDLVLTTVEDADRVRFVVTSLATARPVESAEVRIEGLLSRGDGTTEFTTLARGSTAPDGSWTLAAPLRGAVQPRRFVVTKGADTLVLEPGRGPQVYAGDRWQASSEPWLSWIATDFPSRGDPARLLCHVFTERPIYRPDEPVLVAGMIRRWRGGTLAFASGTGEVVVTAPNDQEWRLPVTLDDVGGFHVRFAEKTEPTGDYAIKYEPKDAEACGPVTIKKEAYCLPTFEVVLAGPAKAALDAPFSVNLLARFFAGGLLSDRPVTWRVTQFPLAWTPPGNDARRDGFLFSSDSRYSGDASFRSTPVLNREAKTDTAGGAFLTLDPTIEPTAQPRQYLIEATVTGDDDIQVRSTQRIPALPPFVLGVKVPRYLPQAGAIEPEVVALDADGKELPDLPMRVRLVRRNWNSTLQASDFAQGSAKYKTEVLDETVEERSLASGAAPLPLHFDVRDAGVYVVELEAEDKAGRRQVVRVDLFMSGDTPVTWSRPPAQTVTLTPDKPEYAPGEAATLLLQSPFQSARALAVVEEPEGRFRYEWFEVANGFGRLSVPIRKAQAPHLAVHVLLMRGRLPGPGPSGAPFDQGKPVTLAATKLLNVTPIENRLTVAFDAPAQARPAQEFDMVLHLADGAGRPVAGEATVWMVDQAVLALAKEAPLDPLPPFLVDRPVRVAARDTRGLAFGVIPLNETSGGDEAGDLGMENISVRKNFTPVPLYEPRVRFGADGTARVHVKLPDTLTVFMLRAKAVSGPDRFGYGTGQVKVRQPVVAQPALPRFVRPGDSFQAGLIGRIVEGPGGAGRAVISLEGLAVQGAAEQSFAWADGRPARIDYTVTVPDPAPGTVTARVRFLLQRTADRVSDGVQVDLPIRPDRPALHRRDLLLVGPTGTLDIPAIADPVRPASYVRTLTAATDPAVVRLVSGLGLLLQSPYGGTEQRMALASAEVALLPFTPLLDAAGLRERLAGDVAAAVQAIRQATDDDGLVAFWPRSRGSVWLTAGAYRLLVAAERAGQPVDKAMLDRMATVLTAALRSDYPRLLSGEQYRERVAALLALADGGKASPEYARELAARVLPMPTESVAQVALALSRLPDADQRLLGTVMETLWSRVNLLSRDGQPVYAGLADIGGSTLILPSETRSLADVLAAAATAAPDDPRNGVLRTGLLGLASGQGWGTTDATAAALRALAAAWEAPPQPVPVVLGLPGATVSATLDRARPLAQARGTQPGAARVRARPGLAVLAGTDWTPAQPGAEARATQNGFILTRTLYRVPATGPLIRLDSGPDGLLHLQVGDVIEEMDELATPEDRAHVALRLPLAAGLEPLNPNLATASAEAVPSAGPTLPPSYASFGDDEVLQVWLSLPRGTVTVRHRLRATLPGTYTQPPATAEMLYRPGTDGSTAGQRIIIAPAPAATPSPSGRGPG